MTYTQYKLQGLLKWSGLVTASNWAMPIGVSHVKTNLPKFGKRQVSSKSEMVLSFKIVRFWQIILDIALECQFDSAFLEKLSVSQSI